MTTKTEIREWLEQGRQQGQRWMLVVTDTFDYEDYPIWIGGDTAMFWKCYDRTVRQPMTRVMEVYDLGEDYDLGFALDKQLDEYRARSLPPRP